MRPNVYILTTGQCGSRVVVDMVKTLGYEAPHADRGNRDNIKIGKHMACTEDFHKAKLIEKHKNDCVAYVNQHNNSVFKAGPLAVYWEHLDGVLVAVYRHPALWQQAVKKKAKNRSFEWWVKIHEMILEAAQKRGAWLLDFSDRFVQDATRHFGLQAEEVYEPAKVRQKTIEITPPRESMDLYRELTAIRLEQPNANCFAESKG